MIDIMLLLLFIDEGRRRIERGLNSDRRCRRNNEASSFFSQAAASQLK